MILGFSILLFGTYIFDFDFKVRRIKWVRELLDKGLIHKIAHYVIGNSDLALENTEKVYQIVFKKSKLKNRDQNAKS